MTQKHKIPQPTSIPPSMPQREDATHKGQVGRVLIIAGSRGMNGAACLSAAGALRGGAGLVRVLTPESVQPLVAASDPCLMSVPLPETKAGRIDFKKSVALLEESFAWGTVAAIGPGLGQGDNLEYLIEFALGKLTIPAVIDADGLNNLAPFGLEVWKSRRDRQTVITPHPGEMSRLRDSAKLDEANQQDDETRSRVAYEYAASANLTVVLKGYRTVVATPDQTYVNTTGNPGMATGGMGDVLTGLIAALLGQGLSAFDAACLGVYVHGLAGDICSKNIGPIGFLARDVAETLPAALARVVSQPMGFKP